MTSQKQPGLNPSRAGCGISSSIVNHTHTHDFIIDIISCPWQLINRINPSHSGIYKLRLECLLCDSHHAKWQGYSSEQITQDRLP